MPRRIRWQSRRDSSNAALSRYIVKTMRRMRLMEELLAIEAEAKYLLAPDDRSQEQTLMQELQRIFKEAEHLFGPRDSSFQLSVPGSPSVPVRGLTSSVFHKRICYPGR
jgi:hypothetical protein